MEDTLRVNKQPVCNAKKSLNPCSNGRYSQRVSLFYHLNNFTSVLILVFMEDTLRVNTPRFENLASYRLNPCFYGRYSQRAKPKNP